MEFQEKYKVNLDCFSTGASAIAYTQYYDMQKFRRIDFLFAGRAKIAGAGAAGGTDIQKFTLAAYQATDSTGGGATAISSATAITGKDSTSGISTAMKCRQGLIEFGTLDKATDITITVGTAAFQSASAATSANRFVVAGASANATVASEAFVAMFNNSTQNTSTAITANWQAATESGAWVRIYPKDPDGTHLLVLSVDGSMVTIGGVFQAHIGIDRQFMKDGCRYVALGVYSTEFGNNYAVTVIREADYPPVTPVTVSKSLNASTSK